LTIVEARQRHRRHVLSEFHLSAANIKDPLFSSDKRKNTQKRLHALSTAALQATLRRVLEAPVIEGDAYRGGLDPKHEAERIAGDSPYRRNALLALTLDPDPTVQQRARALL
jgi:hypothetical protein